MTAPNASEILAYHDTCLQAAGWPDEFEPRHSSGEWQVIELNHRYNCRLWNEEDLARRRTVADSEIARNKRAIDGFNQKRNDAIERIDEVLLERFSSIERRVG